ncbi:MAG: heat-inducible transcription repressor HrcA [Candidatus Omnitrophica bacterium]|nr:heat-inducible transcription repressor HrcA [Candidatus Omnitrophota bacterium]
MPNPDKEQRKLIVLSHIVNEYVSGASPVSSKTVGRLMGGNISSATVRNIMAALEDEGYIAQPHTSAGRVPTQEGYRRFVDMARDRIRLQKREAQRLRKEYDRRISTIKEVLEKTSRIISRELNNAGLVMWPSIEDLYLKKIELVRINAENVLAVLVTMTNAVKNHMIRLEEGLEKNDLSEIANFINENFEARSFYDISEALKNIAAGSGREKGPDALRLSSRALEVIDSVIASNIENELYWEGLERFIEEPEFRELRATRRIFEAFREKRDLVRLMKGELPDMDVQIHIGRENKSASLWGCSVVTSGYSLFGRTVGRIGVVGPTRMDYCRALRTLRCLSGLISLKLEEINS